MNKTLLITSLVFMGMIGGILGVKIWQPNREQLGEARDKAIEKAIEKGDYRCCIEPACTMCFWEANEWNTFTAGTCACDDLLAEGKDVCPQCQKAGCDKDSDGSCKVNKLGENYNEK